MKKFGLVGFPNVGKSSLFNALTGAEVLAAPYPFATVEANIGVADVPDKRLWDLAEMSKSQKVVPSSVHFTDIGGLVEGASEGEGLGNQFLSEIRESDAIVYVLRDFSSKDLPPAESLASQLSILETELSLSDYESAQRQLEKRQRQSKADVAPQEDLLSLEKATELLGKGVPLYKSGLTAVEREHIQQCFFLTSKPALVVQNIDESEIQNAQSADTRKAEIEGMEIIKLSVQLEAEAAQLSDKERQEFLSEYGLEGDALEYFIKSVYGLLNLRSFFTTGPTESRSWTFEAGSTAAECAGLIHTDMERGFIKAETVFWEELLKQKSWNAAKDAGKIRSEGKDHLPSDGDVMEFRFNV